MSRTFKDSVRDHYTMARMEARLQSAEARLQRSITAWFPRCEDVITEMDRASYWRGAWNKAILTAARTNIRAGV